MLCTITNYNFNRLNTLEIWPKVELLNTKSAPPLLRAEMMELFEFVFFILGLTLWLN